MVLFGIEHEFLFEHLAVWIERDPKAVDYPFRINNETVFKVTFM